MQLPASYVTQTEWDIGAAYNLLKIISNENNYCKICSRFSNDVVEGPGSSVESFTNSAWLCMCHLHDQIYFSLLNITMIDLALSILLVWKELYTRVKRLRFKKKKKRLRFEPCRFLILRHWSIQILWVLVFSFMKFCYLAGLPNRS